MSSIPLNAEGRKVAERWDPADERRLVQGLRRRRDHADAGPPPHRRGQDDSTLKIETDAGQQTRLFPFDASRPAAGVAPGHFGGQLGACRPARRPVAARGPR